MGAKKRVFVEVFSKHYGQVFFMLLLGKANTDKMPMYQRCSEAEDMAQDSAEEISGITLNVYLYVAKRGKPTGPREVMKGAGLSSPSVAYRHLQKLEDLGVLAKDEFGEYTVKRKAAMKGQVWLGRHLVPKMWLYASVFLAILVVELYVLFVHFSVETYEFKVFFLLLTLITGAAFAVFAVEGALQGRRRLGSVAAE